MSEASFHFTLSSKYKQILVVSGHECCLIPKKKTTTNWNYSKYRTHKSRATSTTCRAPIYKKKEKVPKPKRKVQNIIQLYEEKTDLNFFRAMVNLS